MLKLHGMNMSNYYGMAKMALLEKGIEFEEVHQFPSKDEAYLARSPMGKVPCIEVEGGFIAETPAIFEYLGETCPQPALLPSDAFSRARTRQIVLHAMNYVDLAARPGLPEAAFGGSVSDEVKKTIGKTTPRGLAALGRIVSLDQWAIGDQFTYADIAIANTVPLAQMVCQKLCGIDLMPSLPGLEAYLARVNERASARRLAADRAG